MHWIVARNGSLVNLALFGEVYVKWTGTKFAEQERSELYEVWASNGQPSVCLHKGPKAECEAKLVELYARLKAAQESPESC